MTSAAMARAASHSFSQYSLFAFRVAEETGSLAWRNPVHGLRNSRPQIALTPISRFDASTTTFSQGHGPEGLAAISTLRTVTATPNPESAITPSSIVSTMAFWIDGRSLDRPQIAPTINRFKARTPRGSQARGVPQRVWAASRSFTVKHVASSARSRGGAAAPSSGG